MQDIVNERVVTLVRGEDGIGVSIQGGIDFKCPVKVYKVYENSPGEYTVDFMQCRITIVPKIACVVRLHTN